ncbi:MAG: hypothetical protein HOM21_04985 [Halobacteriovoraceae bacterium]|jgi:hypothetical protein|nr:hypothetical protein [Halobacteriovoraceae bacterium]
MNAIKNLTLSVAMLFSIIAVENTAKAEGGYPAAVKEIFLKGSLDGKRLFMVLGFEDAKTVFDKSLKEAVNLKDLRDIGEDIKDLPANFKPIYNGGEDDIQQHVGEAAEFSKKEAKQIFKAPFKTLQKIPQAYSVQMDRAREAYFETENQIAASVKYAGHAVWANVEGAYYLVIEAPAKALFHSMTTLLAVPAVIALDVAHSAALMTWDLGKITLKVSYQLTKAIYQGGKAVVTAAYAGISTGVAILATSVAAGAVGVAVGVQWIASRPIYIANPSRLTLETKIEGKGLIELRSKFAQKVDSETLDKLGVNAKKVQTSGDRLSSKVILYHKTEKGKLKKAVKVKITVNKGKVKIYTFVYAGQVRRLKKIMKAKGKSRKEIRQELKELLAANIVNTVATLGLAE